jgi:hypothetical protein
MGWRFLLVRSVVEFLLVTRPRSMCNPTIVPVVGFVLERWSG